MLFPTDGLVLTLNQPPPAVCCVCSHRPLHAYIYLRRNSSDCFNAMTFCLLHHNFPYDIQVLLKHWRWLDVPNCPWDWWIQVIHVVQVIHVIQVMHVIHVMHVIQMIQVLCCWTSILYLIKHPFVLFGAGFFQFLVDCCGERKEGLLSTHWTWWLCTKIEQCIFLSSCEA